MPSGLPGPPARVVFHDAGRPCHLRSRFRSDGLRCLWEARVRSRCTDRTACYARDRPPFASPAQTEATGWGKNTPPQDRKSSPYNLGWHYPHVLGAIVRICRIVDALCARFDSIAQLQTRACAREADRGMIRPRVRNQSC